MHTPFDNPAPEDFLRKTEDYARDLAWGVTKGWWGRVLRDVGPYGTATCIPNVAEIKDFVADFYLRQDIGDGLPAVINAALEEKGDTLADNSRAYIHKWHATITPPLTSELKLWGYVLEENGFVNLTNNAFELLKRPIRTPLVFISYRRETSSPLALAIEARLRSLGHQEIFIDKDIPAGEQWLDVLKERINQCEYFVVLIDEAFFESPWCRNEYEWAVSQGKTIIPFIHPEVNMTTFDETFTATQFIDCRGKKSAASYEDGINRLLTRLGYATY